MAPDPSAEPSPDGLAIKSAVRISEQHDVNREVQSRLSPELLDRVRREAEMALLGGERKYTRDEVSELTGVSLEHTAALWTAMGFAISPDPTERNYTDADVEALRGLSQLAQIGVLTTDIEGAMVRATAQAMSRMAEWQVSLMIRHLGQELLANQPDDGQVQFAEEFVVDSVHRATEFMLPLMQSLQTHVWRRHLAAAVERTVVRASDSNETQLLAIGFADMVGYTHLTRRIDVGSLTDLLEDFESTATRVIAENHGWIIKNLGDEVMFAVTNPDDAAAIGLALQDAIKSLDDLPMIRVGMAYGPVLLRFGDAFGSVVNIAARLTSSAKPGTVLIDNALNDALSEDGAVETRSLRPLKVRGFSKLRPHLLRHRKHPERGDVAE
ncbi:adenylate/guanylate cyclase domain-containing protein [Tomitella biformata]|uniref:adenylate/guanylate cyclase domain-containing protein n=1 Tax=Tomitella biformata TaxID=630403 RepID=UPI00046572E6|nr:adenylate/guanylate cyclase domain-containing protein [Tomitella biformata]